MSIHYLVTSFVCKSSVSLSQLIRKIQILSVSDNVFTDLMVCRHIGHSMTLDDPLQTDVAHSQILEHKMSSCSSFCCTHIYSSLCSSCLDLRPEQA